MNALVSRSDAPLIEGWSLQEEGLVTFREAPLSLSTDLSPAADPEMTSILLVSAPGAVGKSTLARQIAYETNAVYINLADAGPVGEGTLTGGLVNSQIYQEWENESTTVLIDGLDEARLKVPQESFQAFLHDVALRSARRRVPTVLFGRTGAVQEAWLVLSDSETDFAVLEIGYYGFEESVEFADARVKEENPSGRHPTVEREALELLLQRLRDQTGGDGDRFAGYAPVLSAVASRVARETNPHGLKADVQQGAQPVTLQTVVEAILERERSKLDGLRQSFEDQGLAATLYSAEEQLDRLAARIYRLGPPPLPEMSAADAQTYSNALETWVDDHPFLDGQGGASSHVFEARVASRALLSATYGEEALRVELRRGSAANPFLYTFYEGEATGSAPMTIRPQHIGVFYNSLRSSLSLGEKASLTVLGYEEIDIGDDDDEEEMLQADVYITLDRRDENGNFQSRLLQYISEHVGSRFCLGTHVESMNIVAPHARVEVGLDGSRDEVLMIAPINIECEKLSVFAEKVIAESSSERRDLALEDREIYAISLRAGVFEGAQLTSVPVLRGSVSLSASWPHCQYPWTSFFVESTEPDDPRTGEALRRLRHFVIACRPQGRGEWTCSRDKIESKRMIKGTGNAVLNRMIKDGILVWKQQRYFLNSDRLDEVTGTTRSDCMEYRFGDVAVGFVQKALRTAND